MFGKAPGWLSHRRYRLIKAIEGIDAVEAIEAIEGTAEIEGIEAIEGIDAVEAIEAIEGTAEIEGIAIERFEAMKGYYYYYPLKFLECLHLSLFICREWRSRRVARTTC